MSEDTALYTRRWALEAEALTRYMAGAIPRQRAGWAEAYELERQRADEAELLLEEVRPLLPAWVWAVGGVVVGGVVGLYLGITAP